MPKILIVEDDASIHDIIKELLNQHDFTTIDAYSGTEALLLLEKEKFDLIILDLMLPGANGEEIIKKVKSTPIIVLSAKISSEDKVNCLKNGANDYMTKPFDGKELLARVEVQLRQNIKTYENLKYRDLELLNDNHTLLVRNEKVNLTKTEYAILKHLLLNQNQIVPKNKLLNLISLDTEDCNEYSLKVHISNIRKKIRDHIDEDYIESIWGVGFKMKD